MNARFLGWLALLAMAACSSSPEERYYTLSADIRPGNAAPAATHRVYTIDAVTVPDILDRPQIVVRSGANAVEVLEYDRWAGPVPDQLQRVLAADLSARLGPGAVVDPGLPAASRADRRITISILAFDPERNGESVLDASWTVSDAAPESIGSGAKIYRARHVTSIGPSDVAGLVAAMSDLLAKLADDIAASLASSG